MRAVKRSLKLLICFGIGATLCQNFFQNRSTRLEKAWGMRLESQFDKLPERGEVSPGEFPWASSEWEKSKGGITQKWSTSAPALMTIAELKSLDPHARRQRLKSLSPAEKFDLFRGRLDFPLTREEAKRNRLEATPEVALLRGWSLSTTAVKDSFFLNPLSHGGFLSRAIASSLASMSLQEPNAVTRSVQLDPTLKIEIPFGASDIKALISYYVGVRAWSQEETRPQFHEIGTDEKELTAEEFHTVLTNNVGNDRKPLTFSFWENGKKQFEPIVRFESSIRLERVVNGENRYLITTDYWSLRPEPKNWRSLASSKVDPTLRHSQSVYIIGGGKSEWLDGARPASVARMSPVKLSREFEKLSELYE